MEKLSEKLPKEFLVGIKEQLGADYEKYIDAMNQPAVRGLRVNTNKISIEKFKEIFDQSLKSIPFSSNGFLLESDEKLGNSPLHLSGAFYLQEPSSMLAVCSSGLEHETRDVKVLDLCAAPGGKTSQIANMISSGSLLVSNEIVSSRASVLFSNVERQGFKNVVVTNEKPENLECFEGFFDYVFVDAPCSGEGMFRKNPETIDEWSKENVLMCAERQKQILDIAQKLVASNGKLIYSTCTFSRNEDEDIVDWFTENYNFKLVDVPSSVKNETLPAKTRENSSFARKFLPFVSSGEGQFVAVFENLDDDRTLAIHTKKHFRSIERAGRMKRKPFDDFAKQNINGEILGTIYEVGDNLFLAPELFSSDLQTAFDSLKFLTIGTKLGSVSNERFEPNHSLFMAFGESFKQKIELNDSDVKKYLHGEELVCENANKGYGVVTKNGLVLGGVKIVGNRLKNMYPKGLRI